MKFFAVVLAALCATAVSAAPQTTPNFSFQEQFALSDIFDGMGEKLQDHWASLKCIKDVIGKAVAESEIKGVWDETKAKLDKLVNVEWPKCSEITDITEQAKCKAGVVEKAATALTDFLKKLVATANWELLKEIKDKVVAECFGERAEFFDLEEQPEELQATIPEQFECIVDVLGDVSKANGLTELWSKTEPLVRNRIANWKQCPNAGSKPLVILCNIREGVATYKLVTEYIQLAAAENPQVIPIFVREIQARCAGQRTAEEFIAEYVAAEETDGINGLDKLKCISEAVSAAVKETDYEKIWNEYKKDLEKLQERVKACANVGDKWQQAKCVAKELQSGNEILRKFFASLKQANQETYERVKKYIKERCFA